MKKTTTEQNLFSDYFQIFTVIDYCISEKLITPALILIYSTIDSISWLSTENSDQRNKEYFQNWVDTWMLKHYPLPCTSLELYAARCGILHTLTPSSDLSKKKGVRQISYAWGNASHIDLENTIQVLGNRSLVAVHVNDILTSLRSGFIDFLSSIESNENSKKLFAQKASLHFVNTETNIVTEFLASHNKEMK
jgi:hypothetical protein